MKKTYSLGGVIVAMLMVLALSAEAATVSFPKSARFYNTYFARAMDPCTGPNVTNIGTNLPWSACAQSNIVTEGTTATLRWAKLMVSSRGRLLLIGFGLRAGSRTSVELNLRFTGGGNTYQDQLLQCPPSGFVARPSGTLVGVVKLTDCLVNVGSPPKNLTGLMGLKPVNIEILGAELYDIDNGKVFGQAGVVHLQ